MQVGAAVGERDELREGVGTFGAAEEGGVADLLRGEELCAGGCCCSGGEEGGGAKERHC